VPSKPGVLDVAEEDSTAEQEGKKSDRERLPLVREPKIKGICHRDLLSLGDHALKSSIKI
jgi:hypothetical protein